VEIIPRREIFKRAERGWSPFTLPNGKRTAAMTCPKCDHAFHLGDHRIDEKGIVGPSVVCPWKCGYHVMLRLDEWRAP
jgi:hypothetical protein